MLQDNTVRMMANSMVDQLIDKFGNRLRGFVIGDVDEDRNHMMFTIEFVAYNYLNIIFSYERGSFGCAIQNGQKYIVLENSQEWYDKADFNIFFQELKEELELRIPDKFLEAKGWK